MHLSIDKSGVDNILNEREGDGQRAHNKTIGTRFNETTVKSELLSYGLQIMVIAIKTSICNIGNKYAKGPLNTRACRPALEHHGHQN